MSLINDALRRASQSEKNRPHRPSTPMGMEPVPAARSWRLSAFLAAAGLVALLLACWFFWQWWTVRNDLGSTHVASNFAPPVAPHVVVPPVVSAPAPVTPVAPVAPASLVAPAAPANPAPAPVVVVPVVSAVAQSVAPPVATPKAVIDNPIVWPVNLRLSAIFFSRTNPRVLINGNIYGIGDDIQGVILKSIANNKVTLEWNGHTKELMMEGQ
jgi:hypothetical protein